MQPVASAGWGDHLHEYPMTRMATGRAALVHEPGRVGRQGADLAGASCAQALPCLPDGRNIAMICTYGKQVSYLTIASWNGSTLVRSRRVKKKSQPAGAQRLGAGRERIAYLAPGGPAAPLSCGGCRARYRTSSAQPAADTDSHTWRPPQLRLSSAAEPLACAHASGGEAVQVTPTWASMGHRPWPWLG